MSLLLETTLGDITIDLDIDNSPRLSFNILKLAKARYYTNTLIYNVQPSRFCQLGDPRGDGKGGCSIHGLIDAYLSGGGTDGQPMDVTKSRKRFMKSNGCILSKSLYTQKGIVVATEMRGIRDTIGSQFLITIDQGSGKALDGVGGNSLSDSTDNNNSSNGQQFFSMGRVVEDEQNVLSQINEMYCDADGRPYADIRIVRAHILDDPFDDPPELQSILKQRGVQLLSSSKEEGESKNDNEEHHDFSSDLPSEHQDCAKWLACASPEYEPRPLEEVVEERIDAKTLKEEGEHDEVREREREEKLAKKEDKSRAVMLEMLGDIGSADMKPPENVLFVCKLNPVTDDEDLQLIFSRFDQNAKAEIIRDQETGDSLQYAFIEFDTKEQCNEAYFKMNNALIDDRRIKVDFSQSVAKEWNKFAQRKRGIHTAPGFRNRGSSNSGFRRDRDGYDQRHHSNMTQRSQPHGDHRRKPSRTNNEGLDEFGRQDRSKTEEDDRQHTRKHSVDSQSSRESDDEERRNHRKRKRRHRDDSDRRHRDDRRRDERSSSRKHSSRHKKDRYKDSEDGRHKKDKRRGENYDDDSSRSEKKHKRKHRSRDDDRKHDRSNKHKKKRR